MLATNWQELYEDAIFEINPDKLTSCIEEAEQAIAQRESFVDVSELERRKLARLMLKNLSRIASSQWKPAHEAAQPRQHERLG